MCVVGYDDYKYGGAFRVVNIGVLIMGIMVICGSDIMILKSIKRGYIME